MGSSCCTCFKQKPKKKSALSGAKLMRKTKTNKTINRKIFPKIVTKEEQERLCQQHFELRILLDDKYCDFSQILFNLYLTGIGGINAENIASKHIKCIINATFEMPVYDIKGLHYIKIPVDDSEDEDISIYFDEVTDMMEKWMSHQMRVVVHCLCGVSRSATLVLAYLMKYKGMALKAAFLYVRDRRTFIKPNNAFFQQLINYEKKLFKKTTVNIIRHKTKGGKYIKCPDIMAKMFPEETETEVDRGGTIDSLYSGTVSTRFDTTLL